MTLKSAGKFEEKLNLSSKNDIRTLGNFNTSSGKSENLHFDVLLLSKVYVGAKKKSTVELRVITLKNDAKFKEELTCAMKNDMRNWANFDPTLESLKIYALIGSFSPKYTMFELKNYRGVKHHYTEDRCKLWGIWWISPENSKILKFALWETFLSKIYNNEQKNYRGVMCHDTEG